MHAGLIGGSQIVQNSVGRVLKTVTYGCNEKILQKVAKNRTYLKGNKGLEKVYLK